MSYSATLRGLTIGGTTAYVFTGPPAGLGPKSRRGRTPAPFGGVLAIGPDLVEAGELEFELAALADADADAEAMADALASAWAPAAAELELVVEMAAWTRTSFGRPLSCDISVGLMPTGAVAIARLVFERMDPLWYGSTVRTFQTQVGDTSGGFASPFDAPFDAGTAVITGDVSVLNDGTAPSRRWQIAVWGGTVGTATPRLTLGGQTIQLDFTIPAGGMAVVDGATKSVTLDGQPRPASFSSLWWEIPPGQSTFQFRASSGDGVATLTSRDASY